MRFLFTLLGLICTINLQAQIDDFPAVNQQDFVQSVYSIDSTANAIVLLEKGKTYIQSSDADRAYMVFHHYKARIKILNSEGFDKANFSLPLYKFGSKFEYIRDIKATTNNLTNNQIASTAVSNKDIMTENRSEFSRLVKFTLPNIQVGSIIDVEYTVISPDIFNYRSWQFQTDIPKLYSEYNAQIPAVYNYNVTLKGFLNLKDTKSKRLRECLSIYNTRVDCSSMTYSMENIPAFKEEPYMLAPKNYISTINFELKETTYPNGSNQKYTKDWKNVDQELMTDRQFGGQIKKQDIFEKIFANSAEFNALTDPLYKAEFVYQWIKDNIRWNNYVGKYSQFGVEDAISKKSGNVADINLALVAALNAVELEAYPILVSTRDNGLPNNVHPVISDFNYVIAGLKLDDQVILLDATDPLLDFSALPLRAVNEKGRIIYSKKSSEWIPLENKQIATTNYTFDGKLDLDGKLYGTVTILHNGLDAYNKRKEILNYPSTVEFQEKLDERLTHIDIKSMEINNLQDPKNALILTMDAEIAISNPIQAGDVNFNPIFIERMTKNPFNLEERNYSVDLGSLRDETYDISIALPEGVTLKNAPKNMNMTLPGNSARYFFKSDLADNRLHVTQMLSLKRSIYSVEEYFGLKELFSRIIQHATINHTFNYTK